MASAWGDLRARQREEKNPFAFPGPAVPRNPRRRRGHDIELAAAVSSSLDVELQKLPAPSCGVCRPPAGGLVWGGNTTVRGWHSLGGELVPHSFAGQTEMVKLNRGGSRFFFPPSHRCNLCPTNFWNVGLV